MARGKAAHYPLRSECQVPLLPLLSMGCPCTPRTLNSAHIQHAKPPGAASPRQEKGRGLPSKIPAHACGEPQQGSLLENRMLKATGLIPEVCFYPQNTQGPHSPSTRRGLRWCPLLEACAPCQATGWVHINSGCLQKARGGQSPCRAARPQSPPLTPSLAVGSQLALRTPLP